MTALARAGTLRRSSLRLLLVTALLAACGGDPSGAPTPPTPPPPVVRSPASLSIEAGHQQTASGGAAVAVAPAVTVRDNSGQPLANITVRFSVTEGGGTVSDSVTVTNAQGIAAVQRWTLGVNGRQRLRAEVALLAPVTFDATLTRGTEQYVTTVGTGGGTFVIDQPDYPFHGLTLTVAAGAVSAGTSWQFRERADSLPLALPSGYRRVGPVLEIVTNQSRATELLSLQVPLPPAPTGTALVLVLRDATSGALEVLPMVQRSATSARILTQHLRGDQLLGAPLTPAASWLRPPTSAQVSFPSGIAQLIAVAVNLPLAPATGARNVWPVLEHGWAAHPQGHGPSISIFEMIASATQGFPSFAELIRPLDTPGGYAEAAPLAALSLATKALLPSLEATLGALRGATAVLPKPARDSLMHQQTVAALALGGHAVAAAHTRSDLNQFLYSTVTGGSPFGLTVTPSSRRTSMTMLLENARFQRLAASISAALAPIEVDEVIPLSSFVFNAESVRPYLNELRDLRTHALGSISRRAFLKRLAALAEIPPMRVELEAFPGSGLMPEDEDDDEIVIRHDSTRIRIAALGVSGAFSLHDLMGGSLGSGSSSVPQSVAGLSAFRSLLPLQSVSITAAAFSNVLGGPTLQQAVEFRRLVRAPFTVSPATDTIQPGDTHVTFDVSVPKAPRSGFRVHWDWGDGTTSENLGLTSATHEYASAGDYTVVATLRSASRTFVMGIDSASVVVKPDAWVGWVRGQRLSEPSFGITHFEATNVRWEPDVLPNARAGFTRYRVVSGELIYWREVACANWTSPVWRTTLDSDGFFSNHLFVSFPTPATGGSGVATRQYYGQGNPGTGPRVLNKQCIEPFRPNPVAYEYSGPPTFFQTGSHPFSLQPQSTTDNPDVLEGSHTQSSGGLLSTWTWRFERVP
jgi:PKD repeat protein